MTNPVVNALVASENLRESSWRTTHVTSCLPLYKRYREWAVLWARCSRIICQIGSRNVYSVF